MKRTPLALLLLLFSCVCLSQTGIYNLIDDLDKIELGISPKKAIGYLSKKANPSEKWFYKHSYIDADSTEVYTADYFTYDHVKYDFSKLCFNEEKLTSLYFFKPYTEMDEALIVYKRLKEMLCGKYELIESIKGHYGGDSITDAETTDNEYYSYRRSLYQAKNDNNKRIYINYSTRYCYNEALEPNENVELYQDFPIEIGHLDIRYEKDDR